MGVTKWILFLVVSILLVVPILAQNCEFYDQEKKERIVNMFYEEDSHIWYGYDIQLEYFNVSNKTFFVVNNTNNFSMTLHFDFTVEGNINGKKEDSLILKPFEKRVRSHTIICYDEVLNSFGLCGIKPETMVYRASKPANLIILAGNDVTYEKTQLNKPCNYSNQCSSLICNMAGFCDSKFKVECCEGTINCGDKKCVIPHVKKEGETYICKEECEYDLGDGNVCQLPEGKKCLKDSDCFSWNCNPSGICGDFISCPEGYLFCNISNTCLEVSNKEAGKEYSCQFQCKSNDGKNGICEMTLKEKIEHYSFWIIIAIILVTITITNLYKEYIKPLRKKAIFLLANLDRLNREIKEGHGLLRKLNSEKTNSEKEFLAMQSKYEKEKEKLDQELKDAVGRHKSSLENQLEELTKTHSKNQEILLQNNAEAIFKIEQEKEQVNRDIEEKTKLQEKFNEIEKEFIKPVKIKGRGGYQWRNPKKIYYPCYWNGEGRNNDIEIHKDLAKKEIFNVYLDFFAKHYPGKKFENLVVHHIDKDQENFAIKNLVIVSHDQHWSESNNPNKIDHSRIVQGNWESGIKELKRVGIKAPHIDELKE